MKSKNFLKLSQLKIIILFLLSSNLVYSQTVNIKTYIPPKAFEYRNIIKKELDTYFLNIPTYNYIPALAEHESCISLTHSKCWNSTSKLKSAREEGGGLFQVTRTFKEDKSIRFDTLTEMKNKYKEELKEASWNTIYFKPEIQIRMAILHLRDDFKRLYNIPNENIRLQFVDAAYNGGLGGVLKERRACGLISNCNPNIWFNNVENFCLKNKKPLYGNRSACTINRHHVYDIWNNRLPKYEKYYFNQEYFKLGKFK